jgi:predicted DCC family thiol-disulfide oxidoreductase YuxK
VLLVTEEHHDEGPPNLDALLPVVLYDGVCGLCNRTVQFILKRDQRKVFRFAPLQGPLASRVLEAHGIDPSNLDTIYVAVNCDQNSKERLLARSDAAVFVLREIGGIWRVGAAVLGLMPRSVRNWGYGLIARNRYRIFGRYETCPIPGESVRARFLDL